MTNKIKMWIANIPWDWSEGKLEDFIYKHTLIRYPMITNLKIAIDERGRSRGNATFDLDADFENECFKLRGLEVGNLKLRVNIFLTRNKSLDCKEYMCDGKMHFALDGYGRNVTVEQCKKSKGVENV